jgi:hypothetical protein
LSDKFPIQNGLKQGDALSPLLLNFALVYATIKVLENQVGVELNAIHQVLFYADVINLLGDSMNTIKDITVSLLDASRDVELELEGKVYDYVLPSELRTE